VAKRLPLILGAASLTIFKGAGFDFAFPFPLILWSVALLGVGWWHILSCAFPS
jgi:hypothetical protein